MIHRPIGAVPVIVPAGPVDTTGGAGHGWSHHE